MDEWWGFNHCVSTLAFLIRLFLHDYNIFCPPAPSLQLICAPLVGDQGLGATTLSRGCLAFTSGIIAVWFDGFHENMILCFCHLTKTLFIEIKLNCKMIWNRLCDTEHFPWSNACNPGRDGLNNLYTQTSDFSDLDQRICASYTNVQCKAKPLAW